MTQDKSVRFVLALSLLLAAVVISTPAKADDTLNPSPDVTVGSTESTLESPQDLGRVIWDVLDAIDREHISSVPRSQLIQAVARALTRLDAGPELNEATASLIRCQNAQEMCDEVARLSSANQPRPFSFDDCVTRTVDSLERIVGQLRLIRAKDFVVEQQLGGNRYVGIGVALSIDEEHKLPAFQQVFPGGPADRGALKSRDLVTSINGKSTESEVLLSVIDRLRGPAGTEVQLEILDPKSSERRTVTLIRGVVRTDSLRDQSYEPLSRGSIQSTEDKSIGWIRLPTLTGSTVHELRVADERTRQAGLDAVILDFRHSQASSNLHEARLVADALLDGSPIWTRVERDGQRITEIADRDCLFRNLPLVVLVDDSTSLTHRVVAAALQDASRATIVGPRFQRRIAEGLIPATEKLPNVPFALSMYRTRLNRARNDREWPLVPDQLVNESHIIQKKVADLVPFQFVAPPDRRTPMVVMIQPPASALNPANQSDGRVVTKLPKPEASVKKGPQVLGAVNGNLVESTALRVARELVKARPAG